MYNSATRGSGLEHNSDSSDCEVGSSRSMSRASGLKHKCAFGLFGSSPEVLDMSEIIIDLNTVNAADVDWDVGLLNGHTFKTG